MTLLLSAPVHSSRDVKRGGIERERERERERTIQPKEAPS
jgi:hypothetical protein